MVITPIQFVVASAITQKTPLSSITATQPTAEVTSTSRATPNSAIIPAFSSQMIQISNLYSATVNLAGTNSQLETAGQGAQQIARILQNLRAITTQMSRHVAGSAPSLADLRSEFQRVFMQIDQSVGEARFNGRNLLDGTFSVESNAIGLDADSANLPPLLLPNLSAKALFGNSTPSLETDEDIASIMALIGEAEGKVEGVSKNITAIAGHLDFSMASIETAQANAYASSSILTEDDLGGTDLIGFIASLLNKPEFTATAQAGKISDSLLTLVEGSQA